LVQEYTKKGKKSDYRVVKIHTQNPANFKGLTALEKVELKAQWKKFSDEKASVLLPLETSIKDIQKKMDKLK